jgi:hypothetical protein
LQIDHRHGESLAASLLCGIQLTRTVFVYEAYSIKHLDIELRLVDRMHIPILARLVAPNLRTLKIHFVYGEEAGICYAILDQFYSRCNGIRNLKLREFDFGVDSSYISQTIKEGFYRLYQLSLERCRGDLRMFVVSVPILNLHSFSNLFFGEIGEEEIVSTIATNYPTIKRLHLDDNYDSSTTLLKFVECCRNIEEIFFRESSGDGSCLK